MKISGTAGGVLAAFAAVFLAVLAGAVGGLRAGSAAAWWTLVAAAAAAALAVYVLRVLADLEERVVWLQGTLDAVPQPITVTDLDMRWKFVNKVTEGLLKRTNEDIRGRHCSEWKADICGTEKCGVASLRAGRPQTSYMQRMPDGSERCMQVDASYIRDAAGKPIGHVEIVTDIHSKWEVDNIHLKLASSLEEMSSAMTELDAQTRSNANGAAEASRLSNASRAAIGEGNGQMARLVEAMRAITESSQQISRINKAIDEIAFQTNILALNAAVEAARAGSAGAGFAVVADEVRNLAARASDAAGETTNLIGRAAEAVREGESLAAAVAAALHRMDAGAAKVDVLLSEIARASSEQAQGISAVSQGLHQIEQASLRSS